MQIIERPKRQRPMTDPHPLSVRVLGWAIICAAIAAVMVLPSAVTLIVS